MDEALVKKIKELLKTDADLDFLLVLKREELDRLVVSIRATLDQMRR
jgi:hypothetical protein